VWLYVRRSIVSRLTGLSSGMAAIAGGRRDVVVDTHGADEVSAMGRAVEVFRQNAIERDALLVERAEAASRLEGLVEERTAELARRDAALRVMFDNMEQGVAMFDRDLILVAWNQHFRDLLQLTGAFLEGSPSFDDFFRLLAQRGEFGPGDTKEMVRVRRMITDRTHFDERQRPDGTSLEMRRNPIPGGGFVSMYTNITERKRADNIVRSMLEHSRGVGGERREVDLNGLVEEALNLAYHGARAQDQSFNIAMEHNFDKALAPIELAPQEITRIFLNLFGNGFYAANKRALSNGDASFPPP